MNVPTIYLEEKSQKLRQSVERMTGANDAGETPTAWQLRELKEIIGLASVIKMEAEQWTEALKHNTPPPSATVVRIT
jgi:hypothetical protein